MSSERVRRQFGENVKRFRESRGLTQAELAAEIVSRSGTERSQQWVAKVENRDGLVGIGDAVAIADVLGVPVETLLGVAAVGLPVDEMRERLAEQNALSNQLTGTLRETNDRLAELNGYRDGLNVAVHQAMRRCWELATAINPDAPADELNRLNNPLPKKETR